MPNNQTHLHGDTEINAIVVDDNSELREIFAELLQLRGVKVVGTGSNGEDALHLYQMHQPDMVFLDAVMPVQDGFYALAKIREIDPGAKIVLVTGSHQEKAMLDNCMADVIVEKPINIDEIMNIVHRMAPGLQKMS